MSSPRMTAATAVTSTEVSVKLPRTRTSTQAFENTVYSCACACERRMFPSVLLEVNKSGPRYINKVHPSAEKQTERQTWKMEAVCSQCVLS